MAMTELFAHRFGGRHNNESPNSWIRERYLSPLVKIHEQQMFHVTFGASEPSDQRYTGIAIVCAAASSRFRPCKNSMSGCAWP